MLLAAGRLRLLERASRVLERLRHPGDGAADAGVEILQGAHPPGEHEAVRPGEDRRSDQKAVDDERHGEASPLVEHELGNQQVADPPLAGDELDPAEHLRPEPDGRGRLLQVAEPRGRAGRC
jgi:hypothetical protein